MNGEELEITNTLQCLVTVNQLSNGQNSILVEGPKDMVLRLHILLLGSQTISENIMAERMGGKSTDEPTEEPRIIIAPNGSVPNIN